MSKRPAISAAELAQRGMAELYDLGLWPLARLPRQEQPQERMRSTGPAGLATSELLAIVLGQPDVALGETLLKHFEGLAGLQRASVFELEALPGIGPSRAARLRAALELGRRAATAPPTDRVRIGSPADAAGLLMADMSVLEQEELRVLLLDTRNRVISVVSVYRGSLDSTPVRIGELFKEAIRRNAAGILAAHNHPSGDPSPSPEDIAMTRMLVEAGRLLSVEVIDHLIIGQQRWVSLKERCLGFKELDPSTTRQRRRVTVNETQKEARAADTALANGDDHPETVNQRNGIPAITLQQWQRFYRERKWLEARLAAMRKRIRILI
jgi:DNA repair protein RadC